MLHCCDAIRLLTRCKRSLTGSDDVVYLRVMMMVLAFPRGKNHVIAT